MEYHLFSYLTDNWSHILTLTITHIKLSGISLLLACLIGVPIGIGITRNQRLANRVLAIANALLTIPSIALFGLMMSLLGGLGYGIGAVPAIIALVIYSLMPIVRNTYTAIMNLDKNMLNAGKGLGLSTWSLLKEVELPLSVTLILNGLHTAAVMNIGIAAVATYIGAGGLGELIQQGISRTYVDMILAGAVMVSILAILVDVVMMGLRYWLTPKGIRLQMKG